MIIEMRTYKTKPGKRTEFLEVFRTKSIPAHSEIGMKILGPFLSIEDADTFFFMRGFPDLPSREPMKAKFYEGELLEEGTGEHTLCQCWKNMTPYWWMILTAWFNGDSCLSSAGASR
jgi:hypothetical protein